jgi:hypothetical protein
MSLSEGPIHDHYRNAKNSQCHLGNYIKLPNDPNAKDRQWLAPSCSPEKHHSDASRKQNNSAREIHGRFPASPSGMTISDRFLPCYGASGLGVVHGQGPQTEGDLRCPLRGTEGSKEKAAA